MVLGGVYYGQTYMNRLGLGENGKGARRVWTGKRRGRRRRGTEAGGRSRNRCEQTCRRILEPRRLSDISFRPTRNNHDQYSLLHPGVLAPRDQSVSVCTLRGSNIVRFSFANLHSHWDSRCGFLLRRSRNNTQGSRFCASSSRAPIESPCARKRACAADTPRYWSARGRAGARRRARNRGPR